ncbi:hypothetical protein BJY00DRAFT_313006 [Aspergillus carlsbadensis]|nr:hypothetical protein BJY00DRAFT_313006 [Aspergillus carlsbadensis]
MSATSTEIQKTLLCKQPLPRRYHPPSKILSRLPTSFLPYGELLRLHKPLGYILVCYPFLIAGAFSASIAPEVLSSSFWPRLGLLCLWSVFLRSGGCVGVHRTGCAWGGPQPLGQRSYWAHHRRPACLPDAQGIQRASARDIVESMTPLAQKMIGWSTIRNNNTYQLNLVRDIPLQDALNLKSKPA